MRQRIRQNDFGEYEDKLNDLSGELRGVRSVLLAADGRNDLAEVGVARNSVSHCPAKSALRPQTRNRISSYFPKFGLSPCLESTVGFSAG